MPVSSYHVLSHTVAWHSFLDVCGRIPEFVFGKIKNVAGLAQSELKDVAIGIVINCKSKIIKSKTS